MFELSIKDFIKTLTNIFKSSPTSIIFIITGLIFAISMIITIKRKKTLGWPLYIIGWIFIIVFIAVKYNKYLLNLFDNLINNVFSQILFPNLGTYIIIIIISNIIYLYTALKKDKKTYEKIINSLFFILIMFLMIYILEQIIENKLNIYNIDIYKNQKILILVETTTILFVTWIIFLISKKIIKKLINLSNKKIENKSAINKTQINNKMQNVQNTNNDQTIEKHEAYPKIISQKTNTINNSIPNTYQPNNQIQNTLDVAANITLSPTNSTLNANTQTINTNTQTQINKTKPNPIINPSAASNYKIEDNKINQLHPTQNNYMQSNKNNEQIKIPSIFNASPNNEPNDKIIINHINKTIFTNKK